MARLHSGDLSIYSAVAEQLRRLDRLGIPGSVTPGVPAFAAAAALLGRELTVPELAQSVVLTRLPAAPRPCRRARRWPRSRRPAPRSRSISRSTAWPRSWRHSVPHYGAGCPAAVVVRASWPDERVVRGTLADIAARLAAEPAERTALVLVGPALAATGFRDSALYDPDYARRFRGAGSP